MHHFGSIKSRDGVCTWLLYHVIAIAPNLALNVLLRRSDESEPEDESDLKMRRSSLRKLRMRRSGMMVVRPMKKVVTPQAVQPESSNSSTKAAFVDDASRHFKVKSLGQLSINFHPSKKIELKNPFNSHYYASIALAQSINFPFHRLVSSFTCLAAAIIAAIRPSLRSSGGRGVVP